MSIKSIRIENLLSYDTLIINNIKDLNCVIGKNNVGKSNLLKLLSFFTKKSIILNAYLLSYTQIIVVMEVFQYNMI